MRDEFFLIFCEKILKFLIIMLLGHLQLNKLIVFNCHESLHTF